MRKVLVVEDDKDNLDLMVYVLKRAGYEIITAETGEEGAEMAIRERPYFVIMDINLPGIDGLEAARRIRIAEADANIPIIAITSFAMRGDMEKALSAGCSGCFEKPIDPLTIMEQIDKLLEEVRK